MTRFGEIPPLWKKFTSLWKFFDSLFLIWQEMLSLLWENCDIIGLIFTVVNGQLLKNLVTLRLRHRRDFKRGYFHLQSLGKIYCRLLT